MIAVLQPELTPKSKSQSYSAMLQRTSKLYEKEEFYNTLQAVVDNLPNRDILIVMGDLGRIMHMGMERLGDVNELAKSW